MNDHAFNDMRCRIEDNVGTERELLMDIRWLLFQMVDRTMPAPGTRTLNDVQKTFPNAHIYPEDPNVARTAVRMRSIRELAQGVVDKAKERMDGEICGELSEGV